MNFAGGKEEDACERLRRGRQGVRGELSPLQIKRD